VTPRRFRVICLALAVTGAAVLAAWVWRRHLRAQLDARLAAWRALGHPVTLAELDAWYAFPTDAPNAALESIRAGRRLTFPKGVVERWNRPNLDPTAATNLAEAQAVLDANAGTLEELHRSLAHDAARYVVDFKAIDSDVTHLGDAWNLGAKLRAAARMASVAGRPDLAVRSLGDAIRQARTLGREPAYFSATVECGMICGALDAAEAILSDGVLGHGDLSGLQTLFQRTADAIDPATAAAGVLCDTVALLNLGAADRVRILIPNIGLPGARDFGLYRVWVSFQDWIGGTLCDELVALDQLEPVVLAGRLPPGARRAAWPGLRPTPTASGQARLLSPAKNDAYLVVDLLDQSLETSIRLEAAAAACAIEERKLDHGGALPDTLEELVPGRLDAVPIDPSRGKPLLYKRLAGGYVVYGVGQTGEDHGGLSKAKGIRTRGSWDYPFTVVKPGLIETNRCRAVENP
jgi:hypothetical protein